MSPNSLAGSPWQCSYRRSKRGLRFRGSIRRRCAAPISRNVRSCRPAQRWQGDGCGAAAGGAAGLGAGRPAAGGFKHRGAVSETTATIFRHPTPFGGLNSIEMSTSCPPRFRGELVAAVNASKRLNVVHRESNVMRRSVRPLCDPNELHDGELDIDKRHSPKYLGHPRKAVQCDALRCMQCRLRPGR